MGKEFDIVVYGASGFTGKLVAEYLAQRGIERWAMAGRNSTRLGEVRDSLGISVPIIEADSADASALNAMCARARVILTTAGPYQQYGTELLATCASSGTDYLDLNGEPLWAAKMIQTHQESAQKSGARIVLSAGFDSIPSDLGVWFLQKHAKEKYGAPAPRVKGRVRRMQGWASGGTIASMKGTLKNTIKEPSLLSVMNNAFAYTPGFEGPAQPSGLVPEYDHDAGVWSVPFMMAPINTKNVHRTNFLLGFPYGRDFVYDEMLYTTISDTARAVLDAAQKLNPFAGKGLKPGEGPSKEQRESGFYDIVFVGMYPDGKKITASVYGDRDPGYGSTSKMISEAALALLETESPGGMFSPAGVMAERLLERLEKYAGLAFKLESAS